MIEKDSKDRCENCHHERQDHFTEEPFQCLGDVYAVNELCDCEVWIDPCGI